jgi:hypothetical protein
LIDNLAYSLNQQERKTDKSTTLMEALNFLKAHAANGMASNSKTLKTKLVHALAVKGGAQKRTHEIQNNSQLRPACVKNVAEFVDFMCDVGVFCCTYILQLILQDFSTQSFEKRFILFSSPMVA